MPEFMSDFTIVADKKAERSAFQLNSLNNLKRLKPAFLGIQGLSWLSVCLTGYFPNELHR